LGPKAYEIVLLASDRHLNAVEGQTLFEALARSGIALRSECGGKGLCGKCLVGVRREDPGGEGSPDAPGRPFSLVECLACQTPVRWDLAVHIPPTSLASAEVIEKPTRLRAVPSSPVTAPGYGLAVDLGTTTIAVFLCDPGRREVLAAGSVRNPQVIFGDDVMSRISAATANKGNLASMHESVVATINQTVALLSAQGGVATEMIAKVVVVGNSSMIHLFLGVDPSTIGTYPYQPVFTGARDLAAAEVGLTGLRREARLHTLPLVSGFLGCDIIAAAIACDLDRAAEDTMLIDVGTNGEIMVNARGTVTAASCATGPALEAAAVAHGMHAVSGAIDSVRIEPVDSRVAYTLIQRHPDKPRKAAGICGSGLVSVVAALVRAGIILGSGRFNPESKHPNLRRGSGGGWEFVLVPAMETETGVEITLAQKDIRAVQLAKGAILTGITLVCREAGIDLPRRLLIAGSFGSFLNVPDALAIGMLPPLAEHAFETVGNAAGEGAVLALIDKAVAERAAAIARKTRAVDLASPPDFHRVFVNSLGFPDPGERRKS
jgi:uncharacterized 2Fe-2S/4Fe-4S cluster protein (DUF4445 family)